MQVRPDLSEILLKEDYEFNDYSCPQCILSFDLRSLLKRKNLKANLFESINHSITLDAPISEHAAWVFQHIYTIPYPNMLGQEDISRFYHGIAHVSRAAMYAPVFANLYRRHGHEEALKLTNEALKLIQIALLFHDAAREDEEEDLWDHESATFLYFYLTRVLHVSLFEAKELAEAMANKDWQIGDYYMILCEIHDEVIWSLEKRRFSTRTIYHQLIHDSDCLDIIRARDVFMGEKLDFYQAIVRISSSKEALNEMAELIIYARSLIEIQGDARGRSKVVLKKRYENENAYLLILKDITKWKLCDF